MRTVKLLNAARLSAFEALAPLSHLLMRTGDIVAYQHTALAFGADPHLKIISVTARANGETIELIQEGVDHIGHIVPSRRIRL